MFSVFIVVVGTLVRVRPYIWEGEIYLALFKSFLYCSTSFQKFSQYCSDDIPKVSKKAFSKASFFLSSSAVLVVLVFIG